MVKRIMRKFKMMEISAVDRPAQREAHVAIMKREGATAMHEFAKIEAVEQAIAFAKSVSSGAAASPFSKSQWLWVLKGYAEETFPDARLSEAQKFGKALDTPIGKELYWASKMAPGSEIEIEESAPFDIRKADAAGRGSAHAQMHNLTVDHQRARGNSYEQAYAHVYSHPDNAALRERVKNEHMTRMMQDESGFDNDGLEVAGPDSMTIDEAQGL